MFKIKLPEEINLRGVFVLKYFFELADKIILIFKL